MASEQRILSTALYLCDNSWTCDKGGTGFQITPELELAYCIIRPFQAVGKQCSKSFGTADTLNYVTLLSFRLTWLTVTNDTTNRHSLRKLRSTVWGTKQKKWSDISTQDTATICATFTKFQKYCNFRIGTKTDNKDTRMCGTRTSVGSPTS
jgi:hypothetical protein